MTPIREMGVILKKWTSKPKIATVVLILGVILILSFVFFSYVAIWGKPYNIMLLQYVPLWNWLMFIAGAVCCWLGLLLSSN